MQNPDQSTFAALFAPHSTSVLVIGMLSDALLFFGSILLARDSWKRLKDISTVRTDQQYRLEHPKQAKALVDKEWDLAKASVIRAIVGSVMLVFGFLFQLVIRYMTR